jgi:hypothetical protein
MLGGSGQGVASAQTNRAPIGLALCVGLNSVNPNAYRGWKGALRGCVPDAEFMSSILRPAGFKVRTLWDQDTAKKKNKADDVGTIANVKKYIRRAALGQNNQGGLQKGDTFIVTYSGHGSQRTDFNNDESDSKDETWCLFDGEMVDDERAELWTLFNPGVRIVLISDSCHSGTVAKAPFFQDAFIEAASEVLSSDAAAAARSGPQARDLVPPSQPDEELANLKRMFENVTQRSRSRDAADNTDVLNQYSLFRQMPDEVRSVLDNDPDYQAQAAAQTQNIPREVAQLRNDKLKTRVLAIGACQDYQTAGDLSTNGLFTARLKQVWNGRQARTYGEFFSLIRKAMPDHQMPNLDVFGQLNPDIESLSPFVV